MDSRIEGRTMYNLGNWITNQTKHPFYARKKINILAPIQSANIKVCGLGQFNFYLNGAKVEDHELDPGWTDYSKVIEYVTFDITSLLNKGMNVLAFEVGNGWYIKDDYCYSFKFAEFMPPNPNPYKPFNKYLVLSFCLEINYKNGNKEFIYADDSVKVKEHQVLRSNVYGSELIDGRKKQIGWNTISFNDVQWDHAYVLSEEKLNSVDRIEQRHPPIKVIQTYNAKFKYMINNREIFDLTQNMSGILEFEVKGKKGNKISIYPSEKLNQEGDIDQYAKDWCLVDSCITYIIGEDDVWEKVRLTFTYFAGRYIAVNKLNSDIEIRKIQAHAITSAYEKSGKFHCDDIRYNKIYSLIEKAVEANMMSIHTDCPTIERFAWQEPNHLMAPSIMYMKESEKLWNKFFMDIRYAQHTSRDIFYDMQGNEFCPGDGLIPAQAPCYIPNVLPVSGMGSFYDIIPWGSTSIIGVYWHYMFYEDVDVIRDNYETGKRYLQYLKTKINEEGFINHGLGDWGNPQNELARENIETAFLYADAKILSEFAKILDYKADYQDFIHFANEIKENYNQKLLIKNKELGIYSYKVWEHHDKVYLSQASQALPLYWGMVPSDKEKDIVESLKYTLLRDGAFMCGEIGMPYVIQTASQYGMNKIISDFILKEEHPSYYAFILDGETTLGEYWEKNPRSHCHDMMGHIIEWYYNGIAGIKPLESGFKSVLIKPYLPESMENMNCEYFSKNGKIKVSIIKKDNVLKLDLSISKNISYIIDISFLKDDKRKIVEKIHVYK